MSQRDLAALDDDALVREARRDLESPAGRAAAGELFRRYRSRVYAWCFRLVHDHERALDLSQDAMVLAWRALPGFGERARFSSWLFAIVRNRCLSALRPRSLTRDDELEPDMLAGPAADDPADQMARRDEEQKVERLLREVLDPQEQDAIWLRCVERMPVEEITQLLGLHSASGARGLLQTARRRLRAALELRGITVDDGA